MKRLISALTAAILTFSAAPAAVFAEDEPTTEVSERSAVYTYNFYDNFRGVEIIAVSTEGDTVLNVPATLDGYTVLSVADKVFFGLTDVTEVTFPDTLENIGANAFTGCLSLESITLPDSLRTLGKGCFTSCTSLKSVSLGSGLTAVPENCFYACTALENIELTENVKELGAQSFFGCSLLDGINIPKTVTFLGDNSIGRHYSIRDGAVENISGFTIDCESGTAAAKYAEKYGIARLYQLGDSDLDGLITAADASAVLKEYASISGGNAMSFNASQVKAADMNGDGIIDARDAALILRKYTQMQK